MTEPASPPRPEHYSYAIYADPAMADSFDRARFGGPVGELLAETQARILTEFCGPLDGRDAIDVGTGTARAALVLAGAGAHVTAIDASDEMLRVARARAESRGAAIRFDGEPGQLTNFQGDRIFHFEWSPDGRQFAFSRGTRSQDVFLIRDTQ